jgi:hypothetical protein
MYDPCAFETWFRTLFLCFAGVSFVLFGMLVLALQSRAHYRGLHRQARDALSLAQAQHRLGETQRLRASIQRRALGEDKPGDRDRSPRA